MMRTCVPKGAEALGERTNIDPSDKKTGIQFHYDLQLANGAPVKRFDPTVENDPPTPDGP